MAYNTGNSLGSTDPRDLSDNSENFDQAINDTANATWTDRFGNTRVTLANQLGYNFKGDYASGIELVSYSDIIRYSGEFYRPSASAALPYTTTATLPDADSNLVAVGDAVLRQDLAKDVSTGNGAALVNGATIYVGSVAELESLSLPVGTNVYLTQEGRAGEFVVKAGAPPSDPQKGIYIVVANGNYAMRRYDGITPGGGVFAKWFINDSDPDSTLGINAALEVGGKVICDDGEYLVSLSEAIGDYNSALRIQKSNTHLHLTGSASIKLSDGQDCAILRTLTPTLDGIPQRLENIKITGGIFDGNWGNQTWAGPDGSAGGTVTVFDQDGLMLNSVDGLYVETEVKDCAQDGIAIADCSRITVSPKTRVGNCGKGGITIFTSHDGDVYGHVYNTNNSPDSGTKPYYTLSSEGYPCFGVAYKPSTSIDSSERNNIRVYPSFDIAQGQGRGISIVNAFDVDIVAPKGRVLGDRHAITISTQNDGVPSNCSRVYVIGGNIIRANSTTDYRIVTVSSDVANSLFTSDVRLIGTEFRQFGAFGAPIVFDNVKQSSAMTGVNVIHGASSTFKTIDVRSCDDFEITGGKISGTIGFTGVNPIARMSNTSVESGIQGIPTVGSIGDGVVVGDNSLRPEASELRAGAAIADGVTEQIVMPLPGAEVGDFLAVSHTAPANYEKIDVSAVVTSAGNAALNLKNSTGASVTLGSGTFYIKLVSRKQQ